MYNSRVPLTGQDGYWVAQFLIRSPASPISVWLDLRPKWPDIGSIGASLTEKIIWAVNGVLRYPVGGYHYLFH